MKIVSFLSILSLFFINVSCSPKIVLRLTKTYPPLDYRIDVEVLKPGSEMPAGAEVLGTVKIGDTGFSTNCGFDFVIDKAKLEARKAGGNKLLITQHKPPTVLGSTCHRITASILRTPMSQNLSFQASENIVKIDDYAILNIYHSPLSGGIPNYDLYLGDSVVCSVRNNFKTSIRIRPEGMNKIWAETDTRTELSISIKCGMIYYLRCGISKGATSTHPVIELVDTEMGTREFESILLRNK